MKWLAKAMSSLNQQSGIHWCHFHLHMSHNAVKSMAKLISQSCGELQPAVCLPRGHAAIEGDPDTRGRLTSLRNKTQQKQPGQLSASIPG